MRVKPALWIGLDAVVITASILVIPALILGDSHNHGARTVSTILDWISWSAFAIELVCHVLLDERRRAWARGNWFFIAVTVVTFPLLPAGLGVLRLARIARVLRLLRMLRLISAAHRVRRLLSPGGVKNLALVGSLIIVGGAAIYAHVEHASFGDSIWWAIVTSATVGYGDISPHTAIGRIVGVAIMITGISIFSLVTGAIAQQFLHAEAVELEEEIAVAEDREEQILRQVENLREAVVALEQELRFLKQSRRSGTRT